MARCGQLTAECRGTGKPGAITRPSRLDERKDLVSKKITIVTRVVVAPIIQISELVGSCIVLNLLSRYAQQRSHEQPSAQWSFFGYSSQPRGPCSSNQAEQYGLNLIIEVMTEQKDISVRQERIKYAVSSIPRLRFRGCSRVDRYNPLMKFNAEIRSHRCAMRGPVIGVVMKSMIDV